jgi:hypothetical protein
MKFKQILYQNSHQKSRLTNKFKQNKLKADSFLSNFKIRFKMFKSMGFRQIQYLLNMPKYQSILNKKNKLKKIIIQPIMGLRTGHKISKFRKNKKKLV